jgi:hypothetical protein
LLTGQVAATKICQAASSKEAPTSFGTAQGFSCEPVVVCADAAEMADEKSANTAVAIATRLIWHFSRHSVGACLSPSYFAFSSIADR